MLCLVRKDKHKVWSVYQMQITHSVSFVVFAFLQFLPFDQLWCHIWINCGVTLINASLSLFSRGFYMDNTTASEPWTNKFWTYLLSLIYSDW